MAQPAPANVQKPMALFAMAALAAMVKMVMVPAQPAKQALPLLPTAPSAILFTMAQIAAKPVLAAANFLAQLPKNQAIVAHTSHSSITHSCFLGSSALALIL